MKKLRKLSILLCMVMIFSLAACAGDTQKTAPSDGTSAPASEVPTSAPGEATADKLNVVCAIDPGTLAHENCQGTFFDAIQLINEPLWQQVLELDTKDPDSGLTMILAESYEVVSPTEWIIHLKEGITFSNGNPFTASDILFSMRVLKASPISGNSRGQLMNPDKSEVIDDYTLRLIWDDYHVGMWGIISDVMMYDEESYTAEGASTNPIGTGPYALKDYVINSRLLLERRDDYWGEQPAYKEIEFKIFAESAQVTNAFETGVVDYAQTINNDEFDYLNTLDGISATSRYDYSYLQIGFNISPNSSMSNVEARRAVCHAIDPDGIINIVYNGRAQKSRRCTSLICKDDEERFNDLDETYTKGFDIELAKQYAESSGVIGKPVRCMITADQTITLAAEMIKEMLAQVGIDMQIVTVDEATAWTAGMTDTNAEIFDMRIGNGINPGYTVAGAFIMGPRTSSYMNAPGAFPNNEEYIQWGYDFFSSPDAQVRSDLTYKMIKVFEENVLGFAVCDYETSSAIRDTVDANSARYRINGGVYYQYMKPAQ